MRTGDQFKGGVLLGKKIFSTGLEKKPGAESGMDAMRLTAVKKNPLTTVLCVAALVLKMNRPPPSSSF